MIINKIFICLFSFLLFSVTVNADLQMKLENLDVPFRLLKCMNLAGLIEREDWILAEEVIMGRSSGMGVRSVLLKVEESKIYSELVLMGDSKEEDSNFHVTSIFMVLKNDPRIIQYKFEKKSGSYQKDNNR